MSPFIPRIPGETGTGKTSLLSLFASILSGRISGDYEFVHDKNNEAGGGEKHSQTNKAKLYEFRSNNGVKLRILDTPGLADTRGLAQDELHKASIAHAIKDNISTVHAVITWQTVPYHDSASPQTTRLAHFPRYFPARLLTTSAYCSRM